MTKKQKNHPKFKDWVGACTLGDTLRYGLSGVLKNNDVFDAEIMKTSLVSMIESYRLADEILKEIEAQAPPEESEDVSR